MIQLINNINKSNEYCMNQRKYKDHPVFSINKPSLLSSSPFKSVDNPSSGLLIKTSSCRRTERIDIIRENKCSGLNELDIMNLEIINNHKTDAFVSSDTIFENEKNQTTPQVTQEIDSQSALQKHNIITKFSFRLQYLKSLESNSSRYPSNLQIQKPKPSPSSSNSKYLQNIITIQKYIRVFLAKKILSSLQLQHSNKQKELLHKALEEMASCIGLSQTAKLNKAAAVIQKQVRIWIKRRREALLTNINSLVFCFEQIERRIKLRIAMNSIKEFKTIKTNETKEEDCKITKILKREGDNANKGVNMLEEMRNRECSEDGIFEESDEYFDNDLNGGDVDYSCINNNLKYSQIPLKQSKIKNANIKAIKCIKELKAKEFSLVKLSDELN